MNAGLHGLDLRKITRRTTTRLSLYATVVLLPLAIVVVSYLSVSLDKVPEGKFTDMLSEATIAFSELYFFLPVWILVFVGQEFSSGYVNRFVFARGRSFYITSKLFYCLAVALFFTLLGSVSFLLAVYVVPFHPPMPVTTYLLFLVQLFFSLWCYAVFLLCWVVLFQSPVLSFVTYAGWLFVEDIIYFPLKAMAGASAGWLPVHLLRSLFVRDGVVKTENYYNPFLTVSGEWILPLLFTLLLLFFLRYYFNRVALKPLSD